MNDQHFHLKSFYKGSATIAVVIMLGLVGSMLSFSIAKISQVSLHNFTSNKVSITAHNIAKCDANLLRKTRYTALNSLSREKFSNTSFEHEIILSNELDYSSNIKEKIATINVYKGQELSPMVTMHIKRYFSQKEFNGLPVGTVIDWPGANPPTVNGVWLECNGQSCTNYPALVAILGKNTVPDYRKRFLANATSAGTIKDSGLPNILGSFYVDDSMAGKMPSPYANAPAPNGAFYTKATKLYDLLTYPSTNGVGYQILLDASRSSSIYGNSDTVQPPSVTVRRFIKAS